MDKKRATLRALVQTLIQLELARHNKPVTLQGPDALVTKADLVQACTGIHKVLERLQRATS